MSKRLRLTMGVVLALAVGLLLVHQFGLLTMPWDRGTHLNGHTAQHDPPPPTVDETGSPDDAGDHANPVADNGVDSPADPNDERDSGEDETDPTDTTPNDSDDHPGHADDDTSDPNGEDLPAYNNNDDETNPSAPHPDNEHEKQIPVLMYHHFVTETQEQNSATILADKFESDMKALKAAGYETILMKDLVDFVYDGIALPDKPLVITIDDGYLSNYTYAFPVLEELEMKATIFIIGWSVGETKYKGTERDIIPHFTWEQAKEMQDSGWIDIQSHTYDMHNPNTPEEPSRRGVMPLPDESQDTYAQALTEDVNTLAALIKEHVGNDVFALAYPYGDYNAQSEHILQDIGYLITLSTQHGINTIKQGEPDTLYAMHRINVGPNMTSDELVNILETE